MKYTRTNKNHNNNKITKKYVFISLLLLTLGFGGVSTAIYLQPSHYEGTTFTNEKTSISSTTTSTSSSSSSKSVETNDSTTNTNSIYTESNATEQVAGSRAYQPTFEVECVSPKNDLYTVVHIPTGDTCKAITYEQAESFCTYMEQIAYGKTSLSYTMDENYNTWLSSTSTSTESNEE